MGRVKQLPEIRQTSNGIKYASLVIEVMRGYKNVDGIYEYDQIECTLWRGIAEDCIQCCKVGSFVGIKGRLQSRVYMKEDKSYINYEIVAEKVDFTC